MADTLPTLDFGPRTAPLGLTFWDPLARSLVADGLTVVARLEGKASPRATGAVNRSGVWTFHTLPGLGADFLRGAGDAAFWASDEAKQKHRYVIEVDDPLGRFVPFQLTVEAPRRGLYPWPLPAGLAVPGLPQGAVPLFSAATRPVPAGMAAIRAELWDPAATTPPGSEEPGGPAAWALVSASVGGSTEIGLADARGRVALVFPSPAPLDTVPKVRLTDQRWPVTLSVKYAPAGKAGERAALAAALGQKAGKLWGVWDADEAKRVELGEQTLGYGEALVVRNVGVTIA